MAVLEVRQLLATAGHSFFSSTTFSRALSTWPVST
jgi:hypothetical protein